MLETLIQIDRAVSLSINHLSSPFLDLLMIGISDRFTWIPLYFLLLFLVYRKFSWKGVVLIVLAVVINVTLTDQISVMMKEGFERLRPCHNEYMLEYLRLPSGCGGRHGFVSSHAANTMGIGILFSMLFSQNWIKVMMILYALLNGYSRIYLGKHYLADVIGGFILGIIIAYALYHAWAYSYSKWTKRKLHE